MLHIAARQGHEAVVKRLLAAPNVDVNKAIEKTRGYTPLHLAVVMGNPAVVSALLAAPDVEVNAAADGGYTPLHLAAAGVNNLVQFKIHIFI